MPPQTSAGVLLYRERDGAVEVLVAHPGGPLWASRDDGAWSIPKGLVAEGEDPGVAAVREFAEETGTHLEVADLVSIGETRLASGKQVLGFACHGDVDPETAVSNTFEMEWPPRSGIRRVFPEIDEVRWVSFELARRKLNPAQVFFVDRLVAVLGRNTDG